jgi:NAD(P)-dependent dehydrogenase (short-subunit alcohol dehydrogenase family)
MIRDAIQRILVTGGSGGIGSAIAEAVARRGHSPLVAYCRSEGRARRVVEACGGGEVLQLDLGRNDLGVHGDLPQVEAVVHCAGKITSQRRLIETPDEELAQLLAVNALGPLRLTRELLRRGQGLRHVLFVLSTAIACRGAGAYAVSKTAALAVAKLLAVELKPAGVAVDVIVPGWTNTGMADFAAGATGRTLDDVRREHPGGKILRPEEIAALACEILWGVSRPASPQFVWWDRRRCHEPVWCELDSVMTYDEAMTQ